MTDLKDLREKTAKAVNLLQLQVQMGAKGYKPACPRCYGLLQMIFNDAYECFTCDALVHPIFLTEEEMIHNRREYAYQRAITEIPQAIQEGDFKIKRFRKSKYERNCDVCGADLNCSRVFVGGLFKKSAIGGREWQLCMDCYSTFSSL